MALVLKHGFFRVITPYSSKTAGPVCHMILLIFFFHILIFYPEDGSKIFLLIIRLSPQLYN
jgi:hypothetical protein